ncbi:Tex family protein [Methylocystis parvus]|uniref:Small ribosomal subunit protein bS1 n=1 Tax=Methylocystis parvus TaxID=134 RepID=A0A6B8M3R9_9HYPH|nr:Tex family protein [Methylocystis parvus]QGM96995.1 RNA-binding transcriptional accessory protein [Methylocystis parvus]WBJ99112.1 RNA-binding transcriptional accessory protein [Methylocystis parvus OBBP]
MTSIVERLSEELAAKSWQVEAAIGLLDGGSTVPFIARYRKEATGQLDDVQLRKLEERLRYLRELEERRKAILDSIESQGKLDDALKRVIMEADNKARLEDIYLPFKPKRRTKAQIAIEAGLAPLAEALLSSPDKDPKAQAESYVNAEKNVATVEAALDGARAILVERFAEDADLIGALREEHWRQAALKSKPREGKQAAAVKYSDYFEFSQPVAKLPSHRILALFRGEKEEMLELEMAPEAEPGLGGYETRIARRYNIEDRGRPGDKWLLDTARWAWRTKIELHLSVDARARLWKFAEEEAIRVFAENLRDLLLAAPAGARATIGLDPGFRTGVKVAVIDATGKIVATTAIYPHEPQRRWDDSLATLASLARQHKIELIAIGNGTASRETDKLAGELMSKHPELKLTKIVVSEAGASVYSASEYASKELPDLDVSLRGAASIARRLQDPLAELVKVTPKSIGVGQYQHDVSEMKLSRALDAVVEDCVNAVGVDVNTASAPLLARVSGLGETLAANIVAHRDANGPFRTRAALKGVPRLGPKAFEQCAGFLRIIDGDDPLDRSGVHPEAYPLVRRILDAAKTDIKTLIGNANELRKLKPAQFADATFGAPTVTDVFAELEKPGRDPRPAFKTATFQEGVETLNDLRPGMTLEGVVTNVAAFGAFVDIGVHQDGLVHISALSKEFVKDPRSVVKPGDIVKVKVMEVDVPRKRISLSMRLDDVPGQQAKGGQAPSRDQNRPRGPQSFGAPRGGKPAGDSPGGLGEALLAAMKQKGGR